jgi:ABC-type multidrug transport system ATPase subunit
MRRKLDLAVSLITAPPVIFLDEPTTGLDPRSRQGMWEIIRKLLADGTTILLTTQYLEEADHLADRVAVIDGGTVVAEGTPGELKRRVGSERVEFQFATEDVAEKAQLLVGGALLHGTGLSVPAADPAEVRHLINRVADAGFDATGLEIRRPTLDDVFLTMTGQTEGATL